MHLTKTSSAALVASLLTAAPLVAAPVSAPVAPPARALLLIPLTLTKIQDLHFGSVIPSGLPGTVTIDAATGNRTGSPEVSLIPATWTKRLFRRRRSPNHKCYGAPRTTDRRAAITSLSVDVARGEHPPIDPLDHTFMSGSAASFRRADQAEGVSTATTT